MLKVQTAHKVLSARKDKERTLAQQGLTAAESVADEAQHAAQQAATESTEIITSRSQCAGGRASQGAQERETPSSLPARVLPVLGWKKQQLLMEGMDQNCAACAACAARDGRIFYFHKKNVVQWATELKHPSGVGQGTLRTVVSATP